MTSPLGQSLRSRWPIYISDVSSFSGQWLLMILLLIVSLYSNPFPYGNLGTFLVRLAIVLPLRKAPIGLVYKPTYVFLCPLASSTHQLPSNLVSPLELSLVSSPCQLSDDCVIDPQESSSPLWLPLNLSLNKARLLHGCPSRGDLRTQLPLSITVGAQDLWAFAHCRPSRSLGTLRVLALHLSVCC